MASTTPTAREHADGKSERQHDCKGAEQHDRHSDRRNQRRPQALQKTYITRHTSTNASISVFTTSSIDKRMKGVVS
jgi:hypothetical protein